MIGYLSLYSELIMNFTIDSCKSYFKKLIFQQIKDGSITHESFEKHLFPLSRTHRESLENYLTLRCNKTEIELGKETRITNKIGATNFDSITTENNEYDGLLLSRTIDNNCSTSR